MLPGRGEGHTRRDTGHRSCRCSAMCSISVVAVTQRSWTSSRRSLQGQEEAAGTFTGYRLTLAELGRKPLSRTVAVEWGDGVTLSARQGQAGSLTTEWSRGTLWGSCWVEARWRGGSEAGKGPGVSEAHPSSAARAMDGASGAKAGSQVMPRPVISGGRTVGGRGSVGLRVAPRPMGAVVASQVLLVPLGPAEPYFANNSTRESAGDHCTRETPAHRAPRPLQTPHRHVRGRDPSRARMLPFPHFTDGDTAEPKGPGSEETPVP